MVNIEKFFNEAHFLNHVNFSGMNFNKKQMIKLLDMLKKAPFILGIHLSDNNLSLNEPNKTNEQFKYVMDLFSITNDDLA